MSIHLCLPSRPLALALLCTPALSQTVWTVDESGGGDFVDLPEAVAAAADGDVLIVRNGTYDPFDVSGKGLIVQAEAGHRPLIGTGNVLSVNFQLRISDLDADQEFFLRGFEIAGTYYTFTGALPFLTLNGNAGEVWVEDCAMRTSSGLFASAATGLQASSSAGVHLVRCEIEAEALGFNGFAVDASSSNVTIWGSTLSSAPSRAGVRLRGGSLFLGGTTILTEDALAGQPGGDAILLDQGAVAHVRDAQLLPGTGTPGGTPVNVVDGSYTPVSGTNRSFEISSPVRSGVDPVTLTYTGEPGDLAVLLWSYTGQMAPFYLAFEHGAFVIDLTGLDGVVVGTLDGTGQLVEVLPPLLLSAGDVTHLACQASYFQAGSGWFLSDPSHLTLLSQAF